MDPLVESQDRINKIINEAEKYFIDQESLDATSELNDTNSDGNYELDLTDDNSMKITSDGTLFFTVEWISWT